jgi:hypothetical protein
MARSFNGSTHKLTRADTCGISGYPVTFACWFNPANVTAGHGLINFGNSTDNGKYIGLWADGEAAGDPINAVIVNPGAMRSGNTSAFSASTWQHAAGVFTSTSLQSWLNGTAGTATAHSTEWPSTNRTGVGALERATPGKFLNGSCAEAAIWNVALTDDEIKALAAGLSPPHVRPGALVAYWPLFARATNEEDWVGGNTLTVTGATAADHPRIIYPAWPEIILPAAAAADSSGAGSSSGSSTVAGAGASINAQAGASAGSASVSGVGASIHEAAGASAGTATVSGVGDSTSAGSAAGSSAGTATVSGVGASVHTAVGTSAGSSTAVGVSSAIERMTSGGLSRSRNRNRKRYLINGRVYRLTQSELVELLAQRRGDVKPETIKVERSQKPRLNRNRMTAQPTGSVDRRRRASIEITLNPMETQFKPLTKADYMALAEAVDMLIDEQDMMDLLAYL